MSLSHSPVSMIPSSSYRRSAWTLAQTRASTTVLLILLVGLCAIPASAQSPPVVVAIDTSRSLDSSALGEVVDRLRLALENLPAETPSGLLAFDDSPRWLRELGSSPGDVAAGLQELELQGNYTLLNDALFVAARDLENGGVVLLATDGRDENSATTVDDIARRCESLGVRILSVGTGQNIEERALRRLALLSNGNYLGDVRQVDASAVASAVDEARAAVTAEQAQRAEERRAATTQPAQPAPAQPQPLPATQSAQSPSSDSPMVELLRALLPWIITGLSILLVMVILLSRRRGARSVSDEVDEAVSQELEDERASDVAEAEIIRLELAQSQIAQPRDAPEVTVDTTVFQSQMPLDERLERTRVLQNHGVLLMRRLGEAPRSFMLDASKAFAVGREKDGNTLSVPDPSISSHHFKIVPKDQIFYFVDLESTNGSYIDGRRVGAKRLRTGDVIRAGQVEFEFQNYSNVG
ncbi:MAG: FHA domain-containing protein [Thermoanaerobaculia bacterium]|nr:FHA domain-containing protein [Thermoanaerobaculia bacterium]